MEQERGPFWKGKSGLLICTGPSLSPAKAKQEAPEAMVWPPAKRGDLVFPDQEARPDVVVLIDGAFLNTLTVSPRELLALLEQGVTVIGASSLGAIRAAELHTFGLQGVGTCFEWFRDGVVIADDEVAVAMDPLTGDAVSEPLIHVRFLLQKAAGERVVTETEADQLFEAMRALYFPERRLERLYRFAQQQGGTDLEQRLRAYAAHCPFRIKQLDAVNAIRHAQSLLAGKKS